MYLLRLSSYVRWSGTVSSPTTIVAYLGFLLIFHLFQRCLAISNHSDPKRHGWEVEKIKDPFVRTLAKRIERIPVQIGFSNEVIMSSCVRPKIKTRNGSPVVLLHSFDSSCLEWRCAYPLLENAGLEAWAVDVLGWGFSDLKTRPPCDVASKRRHLYKLWKSYMEKPMVLVGPSLGASVAIDFTAHYPEAVEKLILINPSVYAEGTGNLANLPETLAYAGVSLLKSRPLRLYANLLAFNNIPFNSIWDWTNVGRLHCLLPWWKDATVSFMFSGGYNVKSYIKQITHKTLIISSEQDKIVSYKVAVKLHSELPNAIIRKVSDSGHLPHVDKPDSVSKLIAEFAQRHEQVRSNVQAPRLEQVRDHIQAPRLGLGAVKPILVSSKRRDKVSRQTDIHI